MNLIFNFFNGILSAFGIIFNLFSIFTNELFLYHLGRWTVFGIIFLFLLSKCSLDKEENNPNDMDYY